MVLTHFAHSRPNADKSQWQSLETHLEEVGELAARFAPASMKELARLAGRWHDAGKYQLAFQSYIGADSEASNEDEPQFRSVPHAVVGATLALERFGARDPRFGLLALAIEAHHGALKSARSIEDVSKQRGQPLLQAARQNGLPVELELQEPEYVATPSAMAVRMLFSALVDADLLNTEAWDKGYARESRGESLEVLRDRLQVACEGKIANAQASADTPMQKALAQMREEVYRSCVAAAEKDRGAFTMTVPTGGGKTLSGLAFALNHALKWSMQRVIVVAPYTSILEQTAKAYRDVLGEKNVIEHHSNLSPEQDTNHNRQACENWDAPVVVTTSVQFLESLHAAHKRACRKLHRVANSVVLLDEVQTFPSGLFEPIHSALKRLVKDFGVTVVHGTATQPLLGNENRVLKPFLQMPMQEIMPEPARHFATVRDRFRLCRLGDLRTPIPLESLAKEVMQHDSALVITHSRYDARSLAGLLGDACLHLSAAMCAEHRTAVLDDARRRLKNGRHCLVVATQLMEAGVDIDFPVVFRAFAGLETLAQAAGRCNREMGLPAPGQFFIYRAGKQTKDGTVVESKPPKGSPQMGMEVAQGYFEGDDPDLSDPGLYPNYTRKVLLKLNSDKNGLIDLEDKWDFPEVEAKFRMIEEATINVIAPYGQAPALIAELRQAAAHKVGPTRDQFRGLQRFSVGLHETQFNELYRGHWLEPLLDHPQRALPGETTWVAREGMESVYSSRFGFPNGAEVGSLAPLIV